MERLIFILLLVVCFSVSCEYNNSNIESVNPDEIQQFYKQGDSLYVIMRYNMGENSSICRIIDEKKLKNLGLNLYNDGGSFLEDVKNDSIFVFYISPYGYYGDTLPHKVVDLYFKARPIEMVDKSLYTPSFNDFLIRNDTVAFLRDHKEIERTSINNIIFVTTNNSNLVKTFNLNGSKASIHYLRGNEKINIELKEEIIKKYLGN